MRAGVCQVCVRSSLCALRRSSAPQMEAQCGLAKRQFGFRKARGACVQARRRARWSMRTCILTAERVETDMGIMVGANARELEAIDSMSNERPRTGVG